MLPSYIIILRPLNCLMASLAVIIGGMIASKTFFTKDIILACIVGFVVCGAGNVINDYFDYEIDKINNPTRPIPSGKIPIKKAFLYSIFLFLFGIALSCMINIYAVVMAIINSLILFLYPYKIKSIGGLSKNITVSYLVASPFLFGSIALNQWSNTILIFLILAFLANTSREIVKDIEDTKGDIYPTLPKKIGIANSAKLASLFMMMAILLSPIPYILHILNIYYLVSVSFADFIFIYTFYKFLKKPEEKIRKISTQIKVGMFFAMLAFIVGKLNL